MPLSMIDGNCYLTLAHYWQDGQVGGWDQTYDPMITDTRLSAHDYCLPTKFRSNSEVVESLLRSVPYPHYLVLQVPIAVVVIGSYFIASSFFGVYSMAVDTLFLCFLEDLERNDGTPSRPYFMSKGLQRVFGRMQKFNEGNRLEQEY